MIYFRYDKTFEGLLSAVFTAYSLKCFPDKLLSCAEEAPAFAEQLSLFSSGGSSPGTGNNCDPEPGAKTPLPVNHLSGHIALSEDTYITVSTSQQEANRVWNGLKKHLSPSAMQSISMVWLSELPRTDELIFRYICKAFNYKPAAGGNTQGHSIELNFADPDVLQMAKIWKKVSNERLRVIQFTRFQKAADGTYFALTEPQHNVLSLTLNYFTDRFHDQEWILYDLRRKYGYYYNKTSVQEVAFKEIPELLPDTLTADGEELYSQLWKTYFKAVCIKERINPRLHRQNLPVRFWKHLTEKR